ncbi:MAG: thioredoxin family protein [Candidatus Eisenbacteria bacterium]|uniref:Thioredoxin family protein n=1 Tax=Eiseniibacteriota bacterium TaxID=2212470 RepID=A0A956LVI9_UNCEI|nr:thioredoxin family protein [Candidatus Eisenbacteria bacterium]
MTKRLIPAVVVALVLSTWSLGRATAEHFETLAEAQAAAAAQEKPLLIDFFADWCGPCKAFTKATSEDADIQKLLESVILYKVDAEKGDGIELAKTHEVHAYPTFMMVDAKLQPVDRWLGYSKDYFQSKMDNALVDVSTIEDKRARFEKSPSADLAARLAGVEEAYGRYAPAVAYYHKAQELDPGTSRAAEIFDATYSGYRSKEKVFDAAEVRKAADQALSGAEPGDILDICAQMAQVAKQNEDAPMRAQYLKTAIESTQSSQDPGVLARRESLMPEYMLYVEKNPAKAVELKRAAMREGWMEDAGQLNSYAWWAFENGVDQEEALALARKGIELAAPGRAKAQILDTAAELCNALNNCHESVDLTKLAMAEDPDSEYYKKQLDRFQEILASKD